MKHKAILALTALLVVALAVIGCKESSPRVPAETTADMAKLVHEGMTLDQVYALMSIQLKNTTTLYPAKSIEKELSGSWKLTSVEGGLSTEDEAEYHVLVFTPETAEADYYMVFFHNDAVIGADWFEPSVASKLLELLEGTLKLPEE